MTTLKLMTFQRKYFMNSTIVDPKVLLRNLLENILTNTHLEKFSFNTKLNCYSDYLDEVMALLDKKALTNDKHAKNFLYLLRISRYLVDHSENISKTLMSFECNRIIREYSQLTQKNFTSFDPKISDKVIHIEERTYVDAKDQKEALFFKLLTNKVRNEGKKFKSPNQAVCECTKLIEEEFAKFDNKWIQDKINSLEKNIMYLKTSDSEPEWEAMLETLEKGKTLMLKRKLKASNALCKETQQEIKAMQSCIVSLQKSFEDEQKRKKFLIYTTDSRDQSLIKLLRKHKEDYSALFVNYSAEEYHPLCYLPDELYEI